jgi:5-methylcytosine-specific restriction endonuclease McrA
MMRRATDFLRPSSVLRSSRSEWLPLISVVCLNGRSLLTQAPVPTQRAHITALKKKIVAASQGWRCNVCTELLPPCFEVDHIIPLFRGGDNEQGNLQALCRNCHGMKSLKEQEERVVTARSALIKPGCHVVSSSTFSIPKTAGQSKEEKEGKR